MALNELKPDSLQKIIGILGEKEHEQTLLQVAKMKPNDVFRWASLIDLSNDILMQGYYLQQMMGCIKQNGCTKSYLNGIWYTHKIGRVDLNRKLANEMIEKHPLAGRFYKIIDKDWFY